LHVISVSIIHIHFNVYLPSTMALMQHQSDHQNFMQTVQKRAEFNQHIFTLYFRL